MVAKKNFWYEIPQTTKIIKFHTIKTSNSSTFSSECKERWAYELEKDGKWKEGDESSCKFINKPSTWGKP